MVNACVSNSSNAYYLYIKDDHRSKSFWTMTPYVGGSNRFLGSAGGYPGVFFVNTSNIEMSPDHGYQYACKGNGNAKGNLYFGFIVYPDYTFSADIRPSIALIPSVEVIRGNGTKDSPYIIKES